MYALRFKHGVARDLRGIGQQVSDRVLAAIKSELVRDPRAGARLRGADALWRWSVGDYRVIYTFSESALYP